MPKISFDPKKAEESLKCRCDAMSKAFTTCVVDDCAKNGGDSSFLAKMVNGQCKNATGFTTIVPPAAKPAMLLF